MRRTWGFALALCVVSFVLAVMVAVYVFEAMPHSEDEQANWFQAQVFARGEVTAPAPDHAQAFPVEFVIEVNGRRFSKYPPGYSLLLVPGVWLGQPWLANAVAAAMGILGTFLLGWELFDAQVGLWAAGLGLLSPLYVLLSGTLLSHVPTLAVLVFFSWLFVRARRGGSPRSCLWAGAAGLCLGVAILIRPWSALAVAVPFVALAVADVVRRYSGSISRLFAVMVPAMMVASLWLLYNRITTGSAFANAYTLWWSFDRLGFGPAVGDGGYSWRTLIGNLATDSWGLANLWLSWPRGAGFWALLGVLVVTFAQAGAGGRKWLLVAPPVTLVAAYMAYWAGSGSLYGPRYYSEGMPFLWVLAACALDSLRKRWSPSWVNGVLTVSLAVGTATTTVPELHRRRSLYGSSREVLSLVAEADLHHALVFVGDEHWAEYAALGWRNPPDVGSADVIFARDLGCVANSWVVSDYPGRTTWSYDGARDPPLLAWRDGDCGETP